MNPLLHLLTQLLLLQLLVPMISSIPELYCHACDCKETRDGQVKCSGNCSGQMISFVQTIMSNEIIVMFKRESRLDCINKGCSRELASSH